MARRRSVDSAAAHAPAPSESPQDRMEQIDAEMAAAIDAAVANDALWKPSFSGDRQLFISEHLLDPKDDDEIKKIVTNRKTFDKALNKVRRLAEEREPLSRIVTPEPALGVIEGGGKGVEPVELPPETTAEDIERARIAALGAGPTFIETGVAATDGGVMDEDDEDEAATRARFEKLSGKKKEVPPPEAEEAPAPARGGKPSVRHLESAPEEEFAYEPGPEDEEVKGPGLLERARGWFGGLFTRKSSETPAPAAKEEPTALKESPPDEEFEYGPGPEDDVEVEEEKKGPGMLERLAGKAREAKEAFVGHEFVRTHLFGELSELERKGTLPPATMKEMLGYAAVSAGASTVGAKAFADVPRYLSQKYFTSQDIARMQAVFEQTDAPVSMESEAGIGGDVEMSDVNERLVHEAIEASPYLSDAKKQELIAKVTEIRGGFVARTDEAREKRAKAFAKLLSENVTTRVKGVTAAKEALNTAMLATGFGMFRAAGYGAIDLGDRYMQAQAKYEGEGRLSNLTTALVGGFDDTWQAITLRKGETWKGRALHAGLGAMTIAKYYGLASVGWENASTEELTKHIDELLNKAEEQADIDLEAAELEVPRAEDTLVEAEDTTPNPEDTFVEEPSEKQLYEALGMPLPSEPMSEEAYAAYQDREMRAMYEELGMPLPFEGGAEAPEAGEMMIDQEHLKEAVVQKGDGITSPLAREIKSLDQEALAKLGYKEGMDLDRFAKVEAYKIAHADGLDKYWLSEDSIGDTAVVLVERDGEFHAELHEFADGKLGDIIQTNDLGERVMEAPEASVAVADPDAVKVDVVAEVGGGTETVTFDAPGMKGFPEGEYSDVEKLALGREAVTRWKDVEEGYEIRREMERWLRADDGVLTPKDQKTIEAIDKMIERRTNSYHSFLDRLENPGRHLAPDPDYQERNATLPASHERLFNELEKRLGRKLPMSESDWVIFKKLVLAGSAYGPRPRS